MPGLLMLEHKGCSSIDATNDYSDFTTLSWTPSQPNGSLKNSDNYKSQIFSAMLLPKECVENDEHGSNSLYVNMNNGIGDNEETIMNESLNCSKMISTNSQINNDDIDDVQSTTSYLLYDDTDDELCESLSSSSSSTSSIGSSSGPLLKDCMWSQAVLKPFTQIFQELAARRRDSECRRASFDGNSLKSFGWIWEDEKNIRKNKELFISKFTDSSRDLDNELENDLENVKSIGGHFSSDSMKQKDNVGVYNEHLNSEEEAMEHNLTGVGIVERNNGGDNGWAQSIFRDQSMNRCRQQSIIYPDIFNSSISSSDSFVHQSNSGENKNIIILDPGRSVDIHRRFSDYNSNQAILYRSRDMESSASSLSDIEVVEVDSETESEMEISSDTDSTGNFEINSKNDVIQTSNNVTVISNNTDTSVDSENKSGVVIHRDASIIKFSEYVDRIHSYSCRSSSKPMDLFINKKKSTSPSDCQLNESSQPLTNINDHFNNPSFNECSISNGFSNHNAKESKLISTVKPDNKRNEFSSLLRAELLKSPKNPVERYRRSSVYSQHLSNDARSLYTSTDKKFVNKFDSKDFSDNDNENSSNFSNRSYIVGNINSNVNYYSRSSSVMSLDDENTDEENDYAGDNRYCSVSGRRYSHYIDTEWAAKKQCYQGRLRKHKRKFRRNLTSLVQECPDEADRRRRHQHNKLERRRRNGLRSLFSNLEDLVRHHDRLGKRVPEGGGQSCAQRMARVHILVRAARIVRELQESSHRLEHGLKCLKAQNIQLKKGLHSRQ